MSVQKLPTGRFRATITDPSTGKRVSAAAVLGLEGDEATFKNKTLARKASLKASERLAERAAAGASATVSVFWDRWLNDPLFAREKESSMIYNRACTKSFVDTYGDLRLDQIDDRIVGEWLAGGKKNYTVKGLSAFFNDAASAKAGRLVPYNPFAKLGVGRGKGNSVKQPPTEDQVQAMIRAAYDVCGPSFAAWLQVACYTGMRPGELDALRWDRVDFDGGWITVDQQFNKNSRTFTSPKNGLTRLVPLHAPARNALLTHPNNSEFCFVNLRDEHWSPSSRAYHWNAVRAAVGWKDTLYLATRHFAGWMMYDQLLLPAEDVAFALGHTDNGDLVRKLYGHRDRRAALERVKQAYVDRADRGLKAA